MHPPPFPLFSGESLHHQGSARLWRGEEVRPRACTVYLTTHRVIGFTGDGQVAFQHLHPEVQDAEVGRSHGQNLGLRLSLREGGATHLEVFDEQGEPPAVTAERWSAVVRGHLQRDPARCCG